ncbi:MAG: hypothetical protein U0R80_14185 [Nocardioidaceae bacterium]
MSDPTPVAPGTVTGGSHGMAATYAHVRALASDFEAAGNRMRDQAGLGGRTLADGDLLESAVLSPGTFAEAEGAVLGATAGPEGLLADSLGWETDAVLVRVTVEAFERTDDLVHLSFEVIDYTLGRAAGFGLSVLLVGGAATAPLWLPAVAAGGGSALAVFGLLPPSLQQQVRDAGGHLTQDLVDDLQEWADLHPDVVQHLLNGAGGLVDGFVDGLVPGLPFGTLPLTPTTEDAAGLLAGLYPPDGSPLVGPRDDLATAGGPGRVPGSLADLMSHLDQVNGWSAEDHPENNGTVEIQSWTDASGAPHHIVYLPGTDDLATLPWTMDGDVRDMPTNFVVTGGGSTAYGQGILQAMHDAGIGADDPVLVVGHSQGGMEGVWVAGTHEFNVTQVVTAGSPVGVMGEPGDVSVLSLENQGDVVPLVDGESNPDTGHHVTVVFDDHETSVAGNHDISHYVNGAAGVDLSDHPSLTDHLQGMHDQGFLTGEQADVGYQAFQITRVP